MYRQRNKSIRAWLDSSPTVQLRSSCLAYLYFRKQPRIPIITNRTAPPRASTPSSTSCFNLLTFFLQMTRVVFHRSFLKSLPNTSIKSLFRISQTPSHRLFASSTMAHEFPPEKVRAIVTEVVKLLKERKETVSVAETVSSGLLWGHLVMELRTCDPMILSECISIPLSTIGRKRKNVYRYCDQNS